MNDKLIVWNDPIATWKQCGGYYKCPKDKNGQRLGPLVAYRGEYQTSKGQSERYVGEEYWNFSRVEQYPQVLDYFSLRLFCKISNRMISGSKFSDVVLAAPFGGIMFASSLARILQCRSIFAEKRTMSDIKLDRHEIYSGENVIILEDVINNFSTTEKLIEIIKSKGGIVQNVCCALNRSSKISYGYESIPVLSVIDKPTVQYRQDDSCVVADIISGNIIWEPKDDWRTLMDSMKQCGDKTCAE